MTPGSTILAVTLAYLAIAAIPGPNFLMTVHNTLTHSRTTGLFTALGIALGTSIHGIAGLAGLFLIVLHTGRLYDVLKIAGGLYLAYVGVRVWLTSAEQVNFEVGRAAEPLGKLQAMRHGLLTSLSNPKTAVFFFTIFTTLIAPETPAWAKWTMDIAMALTAVVWYSLVAVLFSQVPVQRLYKRLSTPIRFVIGGLFIGLGVRVATART
jgi:RhtB (resistance to homoserine/threonine) family protein